LPANVLAPIHPTTAAVSEAADAVEEADVAAEVTAAVDAEVEAAAAEEAPVTTAANPVICPANVRINLAEAEEEAAAAVSVHRTTAVDTIATMIGAAAEVVAAAAELVINVVKAAILLVIVPMLEEDAEAVVEAEAAEIANVFRAENLGIFLVNAPAAAKFSVTDVARAVTFLAIVRTPTTIVTIAPMRPKHPIRRRCSKFLRRLFGWSAVFSFFFLFSFSFVG